MTRNRNALPDHPSESADRSAVQLGRGSWFWLTLAASGAQTFAYVLAEVVIFAPNPPAWLIFPPFIGVVVVAPILALATLAIVIFARVRRQLGLVVLVLVVFVFAAELIIFVLLAMYAPSVDVFQ